MMTVRRVALAPLLLALAAGCSPDRDRQEPGETRSATSAGSEPEPLAPAEPADPTGERDAPTGGATVTDRGEDEGHRSSRPEGAPPAASPRIQGRVDPRPAVLRLEVEPSSADRAEDGAGNVVAASRAVAFTIHADAWPGRALDPVLHAGNLELRHYSYPGPGLLRFVAADRDAIPAGTPLWLQYGDDQRSRVDLGTMR